MRFLRIFGSILLAGAALLNQGCGGGTWCADCEKSQAVLGLNYQTNLVYTQGQVISPNLPNPSGGTPALYAVASGSLPPGLTLDPVTGQITGIPASTGVYTVVVQATNNANGATQTITLTVVAATPLGLSYPSPLLGTVGVAIPTQTPTVTLPTPGVTTTFAVTTGTLPAGLSLNAATGAITGTPSAIGSSTFTVRATNGTRTATATPVYTFQASTALALAYATPLQFPVGTALSQGPVLTNATPGLATTYALATGVLPNGLVLNAATGVVTGTPTAAGIYAFSVTVAHGAQNATAAAVWTVTPATGLTLSYPSPVTLQPGTVITALPPTLGQIVPGSPTAYTLASGSLPPGLVLDPVTGLITGTPTTPGTWTVTVQVAQAGRTAVASITFIVPPTTPLSLAYATPLALTSGTAIPAQNPTVGNATPGLASTFALTGGGLPPGLALDPATGVVSGTPTQAGVFTYSITVTNGARTASATVTTVVAPAGSLTLTYATPVTFPSGAAIPAQAATLANPTPGVATTFALGSGSLPTGLALATATGAITGIPTVAGSFSFTVVATNGTRTAPAAVTYIVTPATGLTLAYTTPGVFAADSAITAQLPTVGQATPGVPTTFALVGGALPPGLALEASTGRITGVPITPGVYTFSITAGNGTRTALANVQYVITPAAALTLSYPVPAPFTAGTTISAQAPTVSNVTPGVPVTYEVTTGSLPPGLSIDPATGAITGTPNTPGVYPFTVTATNGTRSATFNLTYVVMPNAALTVAYTTPQVFTAGSAIATQTPTVANETPGITSTFAVTTGSLPTGLTLNANGTVTGTPTAPGVYTLVITATNGTRSATSGTLTWTVTPAAALTVSYTTPLVFTAGSAIATQTPTVANETPGITSTFAVTTGSLPTGLTLNANGTVTGTPTVPGVYTLVITATNGTRSATSGTLTWTVTPAAALTVSYTTPLVFTAGSAIATQTPTVANETPGVTTTFAVTTGSLPTGLTLNADGTVTGTPTAPGVYAFVITATNGTRSATSGTLTWTVTPAAALTVSYTTPLVFTAGSAIATQTPTVANETPGVTTTFAVTTGSLPTGLTLNADGTVTGTPTAPGVYTFVITATNGTRSATSGTLTWTVTPAAALTVAYVTPRNFPVNTAIATQTPTVSNETPGITTTFAVSSGSLPTGLTLNASGTITGTPTASAVYTFVVTATNGTRSATSGTLTWTVASAAPTALNYTTPVTYLQNAAITPNLPAPTGGAPTSYAVTVGTLPAGLSLDPSTGIISGTPTNATAGQVSVTIRGTNAAGNASQAVLITVDPAAPTSLNYSTPVTYTSGTAITPNLPAPAGGTPSGYAITSGILPAGLSIDPTTGIISGTPTAPSSGAVSITIRGTNLNGNASQTISITVNDAAPTALNYGTPKIYTNGTPISANNPNPTGGTPNAYTVTAGALPSGLTLNATTGVISGTPTAPYTAANLTIRGSNGVGNASQTINLTVNDTTPTALHYATPVVYAVGEAVSNPANPQGGTPTSYAITAGSLPAGLALNTTTGLISGNPTATTAGAVTVTIRGSNAMGNASQTVSINVPPPIVVAFSGNPITVPVGTASSLTALYSGGSGTIDQGIGATNSGAVVTTGVINSPQSITYTLTVTNGVPAQTATSSVTITWVAALSSLSLHIPDGGNVSTPDVVNPADDFYGVKVQVPVFIAGCGDTDMTVLREAGLPAGATVSAPAVARSDTYNFTTTAGLPFRTPITITLPYDPTGLTAADVPMAFYWDPAYSIWVANGLKTLDTTNHRVTFTTLLPGRYTVLVIPGLASALATVTTPWTYNVDGWFQPNQGVFDTPGGSSFGMSSFASWYFKQRKATNANAGLYTLFRQGPIASDDVNARALISRLANGTLEGWSYIASQGQYTLTNTQTGLALITALRITGQPQIFVMGEARPTVLNALSTVVHSYDNATGKFSVMDPNYPGTALTITWSPSGSGSFTAYERDAGYIPAFAAYAMEGHTSIHRLVDYERAFTGASAGWTTPPFASLGLSQVGDQVSPVLDGTTIQIMDASSVSISGTVTNGDTTATHIFHNQNGGARTAVPLAGTSFNFNIGALVDPYGTRVMLETTSNPCDPTFAHTGFLEFSVKDRALQPWFPNTCFEGGLKADGLTPTGWTLQQGSNTSIGYPATPIWSAQGAMTNYAMSSWAVSPIDSALVNIGNDPNVPSIVKVLDGTSAFRVNDGANGAHISRVFQTITVPTTVAVPKLSFYWAAVMEDPGHSPADQPYVDILIQDVTDANNVTIVYYKHFYAGDPTYPGWVTNVGWKAIPWQKVNLANLTAYKGHQLKITITAADCTQTGHGGYAYLDNIGCN